MQPTKRVNALMNISSCSLLASRIENGASDSNCSFEELDPCHRVIIIWASCWWNSCLAADLWMKAPYYSPSICLSCDYMREIRPEACPFLEASFTEPGTAIRRSATRLGHASKGPQSCLPSSGSVLTLPPADFS